MLSFNPLFWYNRIDMGFDYNTEASVTGNRMDIAMNRTCAYEFFEEPLMDGILVSRTLLESKINLKRNKDNIYYISAHGGKRIFPDIPAYCKTTGTKFLTFADPGTWSYANYFKLPDLLYDTEDLIDYYSHMKYDIAGSVDWPIIDRVMTTVDGKRKFSDLSDKIKEKRRKLTLELAQDFINKCRKRNHINFMPFGTIQGYSMETYRKSLRAILKMGYDYIAIGGLPAYSEERVVDILAMIKKEIDKAGMRGIGLHMYGRFPAPSNTGYFLECGVSSFDNNSSFIYATKNNCSFVNPAYKESGTVPIHPCISIKIPMPKGPMISRIRRFFPDKYEEVLASCNTAFKLFCVYSQTHKEKDKKKFVRSYKKMNRDLEDVRRVKLGSEAKFKLALKTCTNALDSNGWQRCGCTSCKMIKDHIYLGRSTNRSYHLFAHNTHCQFVRFRRELEKAKNLVDSSCLYDWTKIRKIHKQNNAKRTAIKNA